MPSQEEYAEADHNLEQVGWKIDYIITHCCPTSIQQKLDPSFTPDALTDYRQKINCLCDFHYWLFGHYHDNRKIDDRFILLWEQIVQIV